PLPTIQPAPRARHSWHGGPPPKYQPRFSKAEIAQAQSWACSQALPHAEVQRARLALLLHQQPDLRSPEAARHLGQSASWVCKWRRRWVEQGFSPDQIFASPRLAQIYDALEPDRPDLDLYAGLVTEFRRARCSTLGAERGHSR